MKKTLPLYAISFLTASLLSGCGMLSTDITDNTIKYCADDSGEFDKCKDIVIDKNEITKEAQSTLFASQYNFQFLNEYTEQLAYDLKRSLRDTKIDRNIVVTTFVFLDDSLRNTDIIGQQIAELLKSDLQNNNLPVSELNLTGYIDFNEKGEFSLSRDSDEVNMSIDIGYICTGTLIENKQGLLINAKIIDRTTNRVVASANKTLPRVIVENTRDVNNN